MTVTLTAVTRLSLRRYFFLHLADKVLSRVHVYFDYIIIGGNQYACLAAYVPCNKNTVISSVNAIPTGLALAMPMEARLARLLRLELCFVICATGWLGY